MGNVSPPTWMANGGHKIPVGPDRVLKGPILDQYRELKGQMASVSLPTWMANGGHNIQVGPDRVGKGSILDWYRSLYRPSWAR